MSNNLEATVIAFPSIKRFSDKKIIGHINNLKNGTDVAQAAVDIGLSRRKQGSGKNGEHVTYGSEYSHHQLGS